MSLDIKEGRRKTFDIKFVTVTEENAKEVAEWCGGITGGEGKDLFVKVVDKNAINQRQTKAYLGDFLVWSEESRSYKAFSKKSFHKAFEETEVVEHSRSSETGRFVTEEETAAHPETTVTEQTELPRDAGLD